MAGEQLESQAGAAAGEQAHEPSVFESLLDGAVKPKTDAAREAVHNAVRTLAEQALSETAIISEDAVSTIESVIAELDRKLSEQINLIMHHADFLKLEGTWRGLEHLILNSETGTELKIRVLNISRADVAKTIKRYPGVKADQSPLWKMIYGAGYDTPGGEPYSCVVGDYDFDQTPESIEILSGMGFICANAHAPFLAAANSSLMNLDDWTDLNKPTDLAKIFDSPEYAGWKSLRQSSDAKYLALTMPRFLSRLPYGSKTVAVEEFNFEEDVEGPRHDRYCWSNSAFTMAANINRAFSESGWPSMIRGLESGGIVQGLPNYTFPTDDGDVDQKCPTEVAIGQRREAELSLRCGLMPLSHWKGTDYAAFISAQSLYEPQQYANPDDTAADNLSARLPYLMPVCRFAHYLKVMTYEWIGKYTSADQLEKKLNNWIHQYVTDSQASEIVKASRPLSKAEVKVLEDPSNPGFYMAKFSLLPHYQLEGVDVSMSLVSKLPSAKQG